MAKNIIWSCTYCGINFSSQSSGKCPRCGRKLTPWDLSKAPLERKPEWPAKKIDEESMEKKDNYVNYSKFFKNND